MADDLATAYVRVIPSLKGAEKSIASQLKGSGMSSGIGDSIFGAMPEIAAKAAQIFAASFAAKKLFDFGKAAVAAYADFEQLAGGVEKIFDAADQSQIFADAQQAYKDLNMSANEYLDSINQVGATFAQTMGDQAGYDTARKGMLAIADYASGTGKDLDQLNEKYQLISRSAASYQSIADQFAGILPQTSADFLAAAQGAELLSDSYTELTQVPVAEYQQAVTGMLEQGVTDLGLAGNTAQEALQTISGSLAATKSAWQNLLTGIGAGDQTMIQTSVASLVESLFGTFNAETGKREGGLVANMMGVIGTVVTSAIQYLPTLADEIGFALYSTIAQALGFDTEGLQEQWDAIWGAIGSTVSAFATAIGAVVKVVKPFIPLVAGAAAALGGLSVISSIIGFVTGLVGTITTLAGTIGTAIGMVQSFGGVIAVVTTVCGGWIPIVVAIAGALIGFIATNKDARDAIKAAWTSVTTFFANFGQTVKRIFSGAKNWLIDAGKNIIAGFLKGLRDKFESVKTFVGSIGSWIAAHKGPKSYDLALLVPAGGWIMQGLQDGIERSMPALADTLSGVSDAIAAGIGGELSGVRLAQASMSGALAGAYAPTAPAPIAAASVATPAAGGTTTAGGFDVMGGRGTAAGRPMTVVLELDRMQLAKAVYQLNGEESQRVGVRLSGGYA